MRVQEVVKYWNNFIIDNNISDNERVFIIEDESILKDVLCYATSYLLKENCVNKIIAVPSCMDNRITVQEKTLYYEDKFFNGLVGLSSKHPLRERLIVCSMHECHVNRLVGRYTLKKKLIEVTKKDIIVYGVLGLKRIPLSEEIIQNERIFDSINRNSDIERLLSSLPSRYISEDFIQFSQKNAKELIEHELIVPSNEVYLFGKTKTTLELYNLFLLCGIDIEAILDNRALSGEYFCGVKVINPKEIEDVHNKNNIRIIISLVSFLGACEQLHSYGYEFNKSVFVVSGVQKYLLKEEKKMLASSSDMCNNAKASLDRIREKYENAIINICPYRGSGDVYLICRYLQIDSKINGYKNVIVVASQTLVKVAEILSIESEVLPRDEIINISDWFYYIHKDNDRLVDINITSTIGHRLHGVNGLSYNAMLHRMIFSELPFEFDTEIYQEDLSLGDKYVLNPDRTIILSPYALTVQLESDNLWIDMVKLLREKDYIVYTNVSGEEKPIDGTEGICLPFKNVILCMNQCKAFIGLRSGLCDVISTASCKMVILYNGQLANSTRYLQFYSLSAMGLRNDNLIEIDYQDGQNYDEVMEAVKEI